ncbi:MAG: hypothetical protein IT235_04355 [Bacteroidia bacterium]|nr:hypothetical protein [Bacteroidia bacterium]
MRLNPDRAIEAWEYLKKIINSNTYSTSGLLTLYDNLSDSYLLKGLYRKALRSINKILMIKTSNRLDIQKNSRMLQLLVHYQLGHYDILPALSKHTLHWITQNATVTPFDTIVLNTFKDSLNKKVSKAEEVKILRRIKNEIALLKTDFIKEESTYITWHIAWIDSKILMKPLIEILKQTPYKTMLR